MNTNRTQYRLSGLVLASLLGSAFLVGCGDSGGPDQKVETKRIENAQNVRTFFDKSKGDFSSLSKMDQDAYMALYSNDKAQALKAWEMMKYGPSGRPEGSPAEKGF